MSVARVLVPSQAKRGEVVEIRIAIQHPMETGFRMDNNGRAIPKNTISNLVCRYNGAEVFRAEMGSGIAANPYLQFYIVAQDSGNVEFSWMDDRGRKGLCKLAVSGCVVSGVRLIRWLWCCASLISAAAHAAEPRRPEPLKSGIEFVSGEIRALQQDDFSSPAMLWVTRGEKLWNEPAGASAKSCASCHQDARASMKGVSARYPKVDHGTAQLTNIEGRINQCRTQNQQTAPLRYESDELLALTAYVGLRSRGLPVNVVVDAQNRHHFERGKDVFYTRMGQMNLACTHCHDRNFGRKLLNDTISQGHSNPYPAYRLEWQTVGSLHRRLRACFFGVRAELPPAGSQDLLDLELFLAWRAQGLKVETPGVRR